MTTVVVDTSALVAIFRNEPAAGKLKRFLGEITSALVPACCLVELALLRRVDENLLQWAEDLLGQPPFRMVELTVSEAQTAAQAARIYGKGSGHRARLNFGDCLVYAAAKHRGLPLLFAGDDFAETDLQIALKKEI